MVNTSSRPAVTIRTALTLWLSVFFIIAHMRGKYLLIYLMRAWKDSTLFMILLIIITGLIPMTRPDLVYQEFTKATS